MCCQLVDRSMSVLKNSLPTKQVHPSLLKHCPQWWSSSNGVWPSIQGCQYFACSHCSWACIDVDYIWWPRSWWSRSLLCVLVVLHYVLNHLHCLVISIFDVPVALGLLAFLFLSSSPCHLNIVHFIIWMKNLNRLVLPVVNCVMNMTYWERGHRLACGWVCCCIFLFLWDHSQVHQDIRMFLFLSPRWSQVLPVLV